MLGRIASNFQNRNNTSKNLHGNSCRIARANQNRANKIPLRPRDARRLFSISTKESAKTFKTSKIML
jgi:hypothetical protein